MRFRSSLRTSVWAILALLCVPLLAGAQPAPARTLVMPFDTGHDRRIWWLGEGASVLLAERLRSRGAEAIGREDRLQAFARLQVPPVAELSHGTVIRVGQLLAASSVVIGSLSLQGDDMIVVRARSIRLDTGHLEDEIEERGSLGDLFAIFDRVAGRLSPAAAGVPAASNAGAQLTPAAFENYIKGLLADTPRAQIGFLQKALALTPDYDRARLALWRVYTDEGEHEKALAAALAVAPGSRIDTHARFAAALSELSLERYDDAYARLKALSEETHSAEVYNDIGIVQMKRGSTPQTGKPTYWFDKATEADPGEADYFFNLGYAYWLEQDVPAATYWLREAVRRDPGDGDAHYVLGWALHAAGSGPEAERELELARRLSARYETADRKAGVPRGLERIKTSLVPPGLRSETVLVATGQRDQRELASFHLERGRRFYERENDRDAIAELKRALYLSPYLADAHLLLGRIYLRDGRARDAIDALKIALWSEETAATHLVLAEAYLDAKEFAAARREAERGVALDPGSRAGRALLDRIPASQ
jgi:tetratricopeptide (TPR) repeat protein